MQTGPDASQRTRPWRCRETEMRREAEGMQCSSDVDEAVVKLRCGPVHEATVMQRCSKEEKAEER